MELDRNFCWFHHTVFINKAEQALLHMVLESVSYKDRLMCEIKRNVLVVHAHRS